MKLTDAYVTINPEYGSSDSEQLSILKKLLENNMEKVLETALIFDNVTTDEWASSEKILRDGELAIFARLVIIHHYLLLKKQH